MRETFVTPGHVVLDVRIPDGSIEIETAETADTTVELTGPDEAELLEIARLAMNERDGSYEVVVEVEDRFSFFGGRLRFGRTAELRLDVRCPHGADVRIRTGSADTRGRGRFGDLTLESGSGDVSFDGVAGEAGVKAASGDVALRAVGGPAVVQTASGDVAIERVGGDTQVRTASGDVLVRDAGAGVSANTASGDIQIDAVAEGAVTLQSASGDIRIGIRRGSRVWVDAKSMSGETSSELEIGDEPVAEEEGPLVELRATSMSGDIQVLRA
jgi:DUF4097 and DUF4098 domain-containing protein YvlB